MSFVAAWIVNNDMDGPGAASDSTTDDQTIVLELSMMTVRKSLQKPQLLTRILNSRQMCHGNTDRRQPWAHL